MPTDISVIVPTYNRASSLRITLESFGRLSVPSDLKWELLVVDNNSTDGTPEVIEVAAKSASFPVHYVWEKRQGRSAALNAGIAVAKGDIIAFTDDDVILQPDWLSSLKTTFDRFDCAAVAGRVVPSWSRPKPAWLQVEGQFAVVNFDLGEEIREVRTPPLGANSAFRREIFAKYGRFRLDLGVCGSKHTVTCDDTEFGNRLIEAREKIVYNPRAVIYHPVDPERTTKKYFLSWYYYNGVSLTRTAGLPSHGTFYFGVPRWLFREFAENLCKWLFTLNGKRFQHRLHTYRSFGHISESFRLSHLTTVRADVANAGRDGLW